MISDTLSFLVNELDTWLKLKLGGILTENKIILGNIAKSGDPDGSELKGPVVLSLVNIEEDRISKSPDNYYKTDNGVVYQSPKIFLNLFLLFSCDKETQKYIDSLKSLSYVIQYFQINPIFTRFSHPALPIDVEKITVDLYNLNFEQVNHLWSTLGGKYLPSVLYKLKAVIIDENLPEGDGTLITTINNDLFDLAR